MSRALAKDLLAGCLIGLVCGGCVGSGDVQVPLPLLPAAAIGWEMTGPKLVATIGEHKGDEAQANVFVSPQFGTNDLYHLYDILNSPAFQASLTNYSCGDPVPKFTFSLSLYRYPGRTNESTSVAWDYSPHLVRLHDYGLECGLDYCVKKAYASIKATHTPDDYYLRVLRKPHIDCSRRPAVDYVQAPGTSDIHWSDWVTYPGPDEVQY